LAQSPADTQSQQQAARRADSTAQDSGAGKRSNRSGARIIPDAAASAPNAAKVREFMPLSDRQIEQRIVELRQVLQRRPRYEPTRHTLGLISVELANRILDPDAQDR
jgi:hypothetical protein